MVDWTQPMSLVALRTSQIVLLHLQLTDDHLKAV
jgi:hypothetical protein